MEERRLFRAATDLALLLSILAVAVGMCRGGSDVWDLLWHRVFAADGRDTDIRSLSGLRESVVAAIEVLALLQPDNCQRRSLK